MLVIDRTKIQDAGAFLKLCPFGALERAEDGSFTVNSACKMCMLCVKNGPKGAVTNMAVEQRKTLNKDEWRGFAVYVEHSGGIVHPVTLELIGKAKELASRIDHPVYAVFIGSGVENAAGELLHYGVDTVFVYDNEKLKYFNILSYTAAFEDFIREVKPSSILVGATPVGRQLAPRIAARMKTGLTADCTVLDVLQNTDFVQIRPAFGGNIMAEIHTPNHRPQFATVRYKVMNSAKKGISSGKVVVRKVDEKILESCIEVLSIHAKPAERSIEHADVLIAAGRGIKKGEDMRLLEELADCLHGQLACTRPVYEAGWLDAKRQIGLSGRTVRPKLIITCGISGSVQFAAGMKNAETIVAINTDKKAPIFNVAHYGIVGDLYEVVPELIGKIKSKGGDLFV